MIREINALKEMPALIAKRNRPMVSGLQLCIAQLERLNSTDPDVLFALDWAHKALALEMKHQSGAS